MMTTTKMLQGHDNKTPVLLAAIEMGLKLVGVRNEPQHFLIRGDVGVPSSPQSTGYTATRLTGSPRDAVPRE